MENCISACYEGKEDILRVYCDILQDPFIGDAMCSMYLGGRHELLRRTLDSQLPFNVNNMHMLLCLACMEGDEMTFDRLILYGTKNLNDVFVCACYGGNMSIVRKLYVNNPESIAEGIDEALKRGFNQVANFLIQNRNQGDVKTDRIIITVLQHVGALLMIITSR